MAKTATLTQYYTLVGDGENVSNSVVNSNSAGLAPSVISLIAGNVTITIPTTGLSSVTLKPPNGSTNAKTVKSVNGDSNTSAWTAQTVTYPITNLTTFVINSTSSENIDAWWV